MKFTLCLVPLYVFSLFQTTTTTTTTKSQKHSKKKTRLLILPSSPRTQGIAFAPNLLFLDSMLGIWGLGVWMQLFQQSSTLLTFQISFLAFIFLFTKVICFIASFDMFLALSCFQLRSMFFYACSHVYLSRSTCLAFLCHVLC